VSSPQFTKALSDWLEEIEYGTAMPSEVFSKLLRRVRISGGAILDVGKFWDTLDELEKIISPLPTPMFTGPIISGPIDTAGQ
jgi:hypothetical protein